MQKKESGEQPKRRGRKPKAKPVEGLGDLVENVLNSNAVKPLTNAIKKAIWKDGQDCGCTERKEKLNKLFSFNQRKTPLQCMTKEIFDKWSSVRDIKKFDRTRYLKVVYPALAEIHAELYQHRYQEPCSCTPKVWNNWREDIELTWNLYKEELETK